MIASKKLVEQSIRLTEAERDRVARRHSLAKAASLLEAAELHAEEMASVGIRLMRLHNVLESAR